MYSTPVRRKLRGNYGDPESRWYEPTKILSEGRKYHMATDADRT